MDAQQPRIRWCLALAIAALVPMVPDRTPVPAPAVVQIRCQARGDGRTQRARAAELERQLDRIGDQLTEAALTLAQAEKADDRDNAVREAQSLPGDTP